MSTHRADGHRDAAEGRPPTPPAAPWPAYEAAIQAEYMEGYWWPFPPATGPTPWTAAQVRAYNQQQPPKDEPPALW
jgi:hypothetical protein